MYLLAIGFVIWSAEKSKCTWLICLTFRNMKNVISKYLVLRFSLLFELFAAVIYFNFRQLNNKNFIKKTCLLFITISTKFKH